MPSRQNQGKPNRRLNVTGVALNLLLMLTTVVAQPTISPTLSPTSATLAPIIQPSFSPTASPTENPSRHPSSSPSTSSPSSAPSQTNSVVPTNSPSSAPTDVHSIHPTSVPSMAPTKTHSIHPTSAPSMSPTKIHSAYPTISPSMTPSKVTSMPSISPSGVNSNNPTALPSSSPSKLSSATPSISPTKSTTPPSALDSSQLTQPSSSPSLQPSNMSSPPSHSTPVEVTGKTLLNLYFVTHKMVFESRQNFQAVATEFLAEFFALLEQPITNIDAHLFLQDFVKDDSNKPTAIGLSALQVTLDVSGEFLPRKGKAVKAEDLNPDLGTICANFFNTHGETFINALRNIEHVESALYFSNLEKVKAVPEGGKLSTNDDEDDTDNTPQKGAKNNEENADTWFSGPFYIAIGVAGGVVMIAIIFVVSRARKNCLEERNNKKSPSVVMRESGSVDNSGAHLVEHQYNGMGTSTRNRSYTADDSQMGETFEYSLDPAIADPEQAPKSSLRAIIPNTSVSTDVMDEPSPLSLTSPKTSGKQNGESDWEGSIEAERNQSGFSVGFQSLYDGGAPVELTRKEVIAPPGKLGIVVDTSMNGPVVVRVKATSPLIESVYEGDIIVAIDNVDTRAMTATAITKLMGKTKDRERKLSMVSGMDARPVLSFSQTGSLGS